MKKIILLFCVLFLCFGFSDKGKLEIEHSRIEENCCDINLTCVQPMLKTFGYKVEKYNKVRISQTTSFLFETIEAKANTNYIFRYNVLNYNGYLENSISVFLLNEQNNTLSNSLLNGKKYVGLTFLAKKDETLRFYVNPHENPLLLQKHKKKDKCATVRCIEYVIGTRSVIKED